jgi:hypothetical protein
MMIYKIGICQPQPRWYTTYATTKCNWYMLDICYNILYVMIYNLYNCQTKQMTNTDVLMIQNYCKISEGLIYAIIILKFNIRFYWYIDGFRSFFISWLWKKVFFLWIICVCAAFGSKEMLLTFLKDCRSLIILVKCPLSASD